MATTPKNSKGRPAKSAGAAAAEAAQVLHVALMLKQGRVQALKELGVTAGQALRFVMKRRRGLVGEYVGSTVKELLAPVDSKVRATLRLITDHEIPLTTAVRLMGADRPTVLKIARLARVDAARVVAQREQFVRGTTVTDESANYPPKVPPARGDS